jgi:hypothetical protein
MRWLQTRKAGAAGDEQDHTAIITEHNIVVFYKKYMLFRTLNPAHPTHH